MSAGAVQVDMQEVLDRMANKVGRLEVQNSMLEATNGALQARVIELESREQSQTGEDMNKEAPAG